MDKSDPRTTVLVCVTCRGTQGNSDGQCEGLTLADEIAAAVGRRNDIVVQGVRCLGSCGQGLTAALRRANGWTYVFGGLQATKDGPALVTGARLLTEAPDGLLPWHGRPEVLRRGMIARVPGEASTDEAI